MANKVLIVLPAYNAERTLKKTYSEIPKEFKKSVLMVDDKSRDKTVEVAKKLGIKVLLHKSNLGYGGNQKTCYKEAVRQKANIVVMLHPDYQYDPRVIAPMVEMIKTDVYDCVLGSRILTGGALRGGMPLYKYIANRVLTFIENVLTGAKLSEYHTGMRAYKTEVLRKIDFTKNSNSFIFDNQILLQILARAYRIGEVSCPCKYFKEASSIGLLSSTIYGIQCLYWGVFYLLGRINLYKHPLIFKK